VLLSQAPTEDADLEALDLFFCPMTELGSYWKENLDAVPFSHFVVELSSEETDLPSLLQSFITKQQELRPQWPFLVLLLGHADIALQLFKLVFQIVGDDDFIPSESVRVIRVFPLSDNSTEEAPLFTKFSCSLLTVLNITHSLIYSKVARAGFTAGSAIVPVLLFKPKTKKDRRGERELLSQKMSATFEGVSLPSVRPPTLHWSTSFYILTRTKFSGPR